LFQNKSFLGQTKGVLFQTKKLFGRRCHAPEGGACEFFNKVGKSYAFDFSTHD